MAAEFNKQRFAIIAAVDAAGGYAKDGKIPWYFKEDFQWFKQQTMNHACVMGRNTYEDINSRLGDKAKDSVLPGRDCYVVSTTLDSLPNATVVRSISEVALRVADDYTKPIFNIGRRRLFIEGVAMVDTVYLTVINDTYNCDRIFPVDYVLKHFSAPSVTTLPTNDKLRFLTFTRNPHVRT